MNSNGTPNNNDAMNNALDALFAQAATMAVDELGSEIPVPDQEVESSPRHKRRMARLIKSTRPAKMLSRVMKVAACFALVFIVIFTGMFAGVEAFRIKFLNFFFDKDSPGSEYSYNTNNHNSYDGELVSLRYIPDGFECNYSTVYVDRGFEYLEFYKEGELWFYFTVRSPIGSHEIDTEGADFDTLEINGYEALYVTKSTHNSLVWSDEENSFNIDGNISKKEIIKIASNIKLIE